MQPGFGSSNSPGAKSTPSWSEAEDLGVSSPQSPASPCSPARPRHTTFSNDSREQRKPSRRSHNSHVVLMSTGTSSSLGTEDIGVRARLAILRESGWFQAISGAGIILTFVLTCADTDYRAHEEGIPVWLTATLAVCFAIYVLEFLLTMVVAGSTLLAEPGNCLDLVLVLIGVVDYVLTFMGIEFQGGFGILRVIRFFRLIHLLRASWVNEHLRELRNFVMMFSSSFKTLFWSCAFCFLVMTFWSAIAVELLNERMRQLMELDPELWQECGRCKRAFASVMEANLTFFQTIVAGDSWGLIAIPVIEAHPWSAVIFVGAFMTLVYGVLGLIVAVIVDMFAEIRSKDIQHIADDIAETEAHEKRDLNEIFNQIDRNKDGYLTLHELQFATRRVTKFRDYLKVLHIEERALLPLFQQLDEQGTGHISREDFVDRMHSLRLHGEATPRLTILTGGDACSLGMGPMMGATASLGSTVRSFHAHSDNSIAAAAQACTSCNSGQEDTPESRESVVSMMKNLERMLTNMSGQGPNGEEATKKTLSDTPRQIVSSPSGLRRAISRGDSRGGDSSTTIELGSRELSDVSTKETDRARPASPAGPAMAIVAPRLVDRQCPNGHAWRRCSSQDLSDFGLPTVRQRSRSASTFRSSRPTSRCISPENLPPSTDAGLRCL